MRPFPSLSLLSGWHSPLRPQLAMATACALLLAAELFGPRFLAGTEHRLGDLLMARHAGAYRADPAIVVIDVDDASLAAMQDIGGLWPWPREIHADLLHGLSEFSPRAVVFDIALSERDAMRPRSDARLAQAVAAARNVYLPAIYLDQATHVPATPLAKVAAAFGEGAAGDALAGAALQLPQVVPPDAWRLGLINGSSDPDGVLRRYRLFTEVQGWRLPSLPARVAADIGAALPSGDSVMLRWPAQGHQRYAYGALYRVLTEQRADLPPAAVAELDARLRDKIVVIGASAASSFDHHLTPLGAGYPGVDVVAVAIDNLKNRRGVALAPAVVPLAFGTALLALLAWLFARRVNPLAIGAALALLSLAALAAADVAFGHDLLLPMATPLAAAWAMFVAAAIGGHLRERRTREQAVALFGRFLDPAVVRQIVEQGQTIESLSGRTRDVTVLFSDIRGFTTLSESRAPHEVVALLNRHFERQAEVVFRHGGTLDKFIGDCIMAFWGAPLDDPDHARHAVAAALEMQDALLAFKAELASQGADVSDFDAGIGVHSGPAVVGFIGARRKLDYTAIGDTVNLASRVEGLTRDVARVLVTHATMQACGNDLFDFVPHGAFAVKGRAAAVELYEPRRKP